MSCCESPEDDPHACAILAADEDVDDVIANAVLCDCQCHWPEDGR